MTKTANAAIFYLPDGFDTSRAKLMGRHTAGEGFLRGMLKYSSLPDVFAYTTDERSFKEFRARVQKLGGTSKRLGFVPFNNPNGLSVPGAIFLPGPGLDKTAWIRRHYGQRNFSLCGVTHTTASETVMEAFGKYLTSPVQSWDALVCTSSVVLDTVKHVMESYGEFLRENIGATAAKPRLQFPVIPLGVMCDDFEDNSAARDKWRAKLGIGKEDIAVLFVGRLSFHAKAHPHPMYVALGKAARRTGRKLHLIEAGWFANEHIEMSYKEGAAKFCPEVNHIILDGRQPDVRKEIWFAADIFTSLSDNIQETFGLTPIEAMAAGLPQVVTDWNGYKDTVREGVDGFRVPTLAPSPGTGIDLAVRYLAEMDNYDWFCGNAGQSVSVDIEKSAEAYLKLIENAELRARMGASAKQRAREVYDWKQVVRLYEELWAELAGRREKDAEAMPPKPGGVVHPLMDDPFRLFATYPSAVLEDDDEVVAKVPDYLSKYREYKAMKYHAYGYVSPGDESLQAFEKALVSGRCKVADIVAAAKLPRHRVIKQILFLVKLGLLSAGEHNQSPVASGQ